MTAESTRTEAGMPEMAEDGIGDVAPDMTPERWECPHCGCVLDGIAERRGRPDRGGLPRPAIPRMGRYSDAADDVMTEHTEHCRPHGPWMESDPALAIPGCRAMGCQPIGDVAPGTPDGSGIYGAVSANASYWRAVRRGVIGSAGRIAEEEQRDDV